MYATIASDINLNDFSIIFLVSLGALVGMWFLTHWLIVRRRSRYFIAVVWFCFLLTLLFGGATLVNSVQKERKTWMRLFQETVLAFSVAVQGLEHWKLEFSCSEWVDPVLANGERGKDDTVDKTVEPLPRLAKRKLAAPSDLQVKTSSPSSINLFWSPVDDANQYEVERSLVPEGGDWETVYRGKEPFFSDDLSELPQTTRSAVRYRVRSIYATPEDDPVYQQLCELTRLVSSRSVYAESFYTMRDYDRDRAAFIVSPAIDLDGDGVIDPVSERPSPIGEMYPKTQAMKELFDPDSKKPAVLINSIPVQDDWGYWITAFAPIYTPDGTFEGAVGADIPADLWTSNVFYAQVRPAVFLLFVFGLFFMGTILIARLKCSEEEQKKATEELQTTIRELTAAKQAADVAARAKSNFLANMSHEIRTPMNAVLGFASILGRRLLDCCDEPQVEENQQTVRMIEQSGSDLLTIINDILDFSKVDADQIDVESIPTSPREIIEDVRQLVQVRLEEKPKLTLQIDVKDDVPQHIFSDPTRLRQILTNLCGNAIKFSEEGILKISCRMRVYDNIDPSKEKIRSKFGEGVDVNVFDGDPQIKLLQFVVNDPGIGMNREQINRLFQPFSQADTSLTRRYGGTGLGLSIAKRLAVLLGGDIRVQSEERVGSTFTLTMAPKIPDRPLANPYSGVFLLADNERPLLGLHFLLVEDGKVNQIVISTQLKEAGATVDIAENGRIGVEKVVQNPEGTFDAILMDMQMPVMDGYEATRYLREHGFGKPIIAVTAHALSGDCDKTLEAGCNGYISKPIDRNKLIDMILQMDAEAGGIG